MSEGLGIAITISGIGVGSALTPPDHGLDHGELRLAGGLLLGRRPRHTHCPAVVLVCHGPAGRRIHGSMPGKPR